MLRKWKKQRVLKWVKEIFYPVFCLFLYIFFGKIILFYPEVFGGSCLESLARFFGSSKPTKSVSSTVPPKKESVSSLPVTFNGVPYLHLSDVAKSLKCNIPLGEQNGSAKIKKGGATMQLDTGKDFVLYQGIKIYLLHPLRLGFKGLPRLGASFGDILLGYDDYSTVLLPLLSIDLIPQKPPTLKTIVLDPGHGGKDSGAVNGRLNLLEKTLTLQIAQLLKVELVKRGYAVTLTRETDVFVELGDRPAKARNADLFVSLHINSAINASANGVEVYTLKRALKFPGNAFDPWNLIGAYSILSAMVKETNLTNRGVKMAEFAVLKTLQCPGILFEIGFINNDAEAKKLADTAFQAKIVRGLADGIEKYGENLKKKR
jgi:N-acetylmuramoyl-L-alanine amidase